MKLAIWKADLQSRGLYQSFDNSLILQINATTAILNAEFDVLLTFSIWAIWKFNIFSALFLQAWIARESGLRAPWIQSNLFENIQTPRPFSMIIDRIPPKFCNKAVWVIKSQLTREIHSAKAFCSARELIHSTLVLAMLTKRSTRSQGFYWWRIPIDLCHYWKWHQSVATSTNSTVCWQIISCTSFCLWLSFIIQMGNWVFIRPWGID